MKKNYLLFFLFTFILTATYGQQSNATNVRFNLGKVSKNVIAGIESYNLEDLKYHARLSKESIEIVEKLVESEQCYNALDISNSIAIYLETALLAEELVTARTYLNKTEDLILKAFYEYDICSNEEANAESSNYGENALTDLQQQQAELKAQQAALEQKAKDIKLQLAEQERQETLLKKQQFVTSNERAMTSSINAYNDVLKSCECQTSLAPSQESISDLSTKTIQDIKTHYLDKSIVISQSFGAKLKACKE